MNDIDNTKIEKDETGGAVSVGQNVSLRDGCPNAVDALHEIQKFNNVRNDLGAYLWQVAEWGLGFQNEKPNPKDYGLGE